MKNKNQDFHIVGKKCSIVLASEPANNHPHNNTQLIAEVYAIEVYNVLGRKDNVWEINAAKYVERNRHDGYEEKAVYITPFIDKPSKAHTGLSDSIHDAASLLINDLFLPELPDYLISQELFEADYIGSYSKQLYIGAQKTEVIATYRVYEHEAGNKPNQLSFLSDVQIDRVDIVDYEHMDEERKDDLVDWLTIHHQTAGAWEAWTFCSLQKSFK